MITRTANVPFNLAYTSPGSTSAAIADPVPTLTEPPNGSGVIPLVGYEVSAPNFLELLFVGQGADDAAGSAKVYLWHLVGTVWVPVPVLNLDVTLGSATGVATRTITNSDRMADTLALTAGTQNIANNAITSPANKTAARVAFDCLGERKIGRATV